MAHNFCYYTPTKVLFGSGTVEETGAQVKAFGGTAVLIVYGSERIRKDGLMSRITDSLEKEGISFRMLGGVVPNPELSLVYEGIRIGKENNIDFLLAVGGGSAIDTAKAIGYGLYAPEQDVWDLYAGKRQAEGCLPVGCVLTIAAAGSEMSDSSVITNDQTKEKRGYSSDYVRPRFAVMDPMLTLTLPDYQTESGCTDMMMHTMERYFVSGGTLEITDSLAEGLMRTVMTYAKVLHDDPQNVKARAEVMWAGALAHNGLTGCGGPAGADFSCHKMEHELGGMFGVTHGAGLAAIWGTWARYVYKNCLPRFVRFAMAVHGLPAGASDEETALSGIRAQEAFYREIGMPTSLHELGIDPTEEQLRELARRCSIACGGSQGSAMVLYEEDMYNIYRAAKETRA